jgi:hypothetical protein
VSTTEVRRCRVTTPLTALTGILSGSTVFAATGTPAWALAGAGLTWLATCGVSWAAERQRRATLQLVLRDAPEGTTIVQEAGLGGPRLEIEIGRRLQRTAEGDA